MLVHSEALVFYVWESLVLMVLLGTLLDLQERMDGRWRKVGMGFCLLSLLFA